MSPILFSLYVDEMLRRLERSGVGCYVQGVFAGALCYADDITLICPSLHGLNEMISVCDKFADDYLVLFNAKKSVAINFGGNAGVDGYVMVGNQALPWSEQCVHLGNMITRDLKDSCDVARKIGHFVSAVNSLVGNFSSCTNLLTLRRLFSAYCCSFYGSQLWRIDSRDEKRVCTSWNKAVRRVLRLPLRSHTWLLGPLLDQPHLRSQLHLRSWGFVTSLACSENVIGLKLILS